jgi:hypothetical protein
MYNPVVRWHGMVELLCVDTNRAEIVRFGKIIMTVGKRDCLEQHQQQEQYPDS